MRVPLPWLREYCSPELDARAIEERLTMTGTKVEAVHRVGVAAAENFVVGRVLSAEQHPDADRLKVCAVDLGEQEPATIVCGAPNVAAGQTVAVARPGAVMPDGTKLKRAKLRGVVSEGMILAASELELEPAGAPEGTSERGAGIMVLEQMGLDAEPSPGAPLERLLPISSEVLELEITPNRPDCLGVYGVARELHAATGAPLAPPPWAEDPGDAGGESAPQPPAEVRVECPELCPRFTARVFEEVKIGPSPVWLKARLTAAGQRPINNVVDITNYVMLATGQPLHAFDLDRVAGGVLTVRRAHEGEQVQTLDGQTRTLDREMVVIEDAEGPTSIAGLMGGARSEVEPGTTRVLMEVATWNGPNIHRTSWALGLRSEASSRFEKQLQPEQAMHAQALAAALMAELCGATLAGATIDLGEPPPPLRVLTLREQRVASILGVPVARERQREILTALDFGAVQMADGLEVRVPALRRDDVTREIDLIEEVARIDGVERLPATLPARRGAAGRLTHAQRVRRAAEDALVGRGLHEIVGWSFADPRLLDRLRLGPEHPMRAVVRVENPLSEEQSIMRPTLLGSLLDAAQHNLARNRPAVALFESGTVYRARGEERADPGATPAEEHHALGALLTGALRAPAWRGDPEPADFFTAKALLCALLDRFHLGWSVRPAQWPFLHPGRSAEVLLHASLGAAPVGFLGELHPLVAAEWDLPRTAVFAVDLGKLGAAAPEIAAFRAFGSFPALRQDLAVILPVEVSAAELGELIAGAGGEMLESAEVFDVYTGAQVGEGRRSLAVALSFRSLEHTLTDEDVAPLRERIVAALERIGGELRG
ncbi:MAG: phenylalanine--tRNA ligase subunit beta [Solirubrobacteraceae bacterium]